MLLYDIINYKYFEIDAIVIPNVKSQSVKLVNKEDKGLYVKFIDKLLKKLYNTQHPLIPSAKTIIHSKKKIASIKISLMLKFFYKFS